jgi:hypothetical protein
VFVGEDGVEGEVAAYEEASPRDGEFSTLVDDVPRVVEAAAVRASGVIGGGGMVAEGVVSLE